MALIYNSDDGALDTASPQIYYGTVDTFESEIIIYSDGVVTTYYAGYFTLDSDTVSDGIINTMWTGSSESQVFHCENLSADAAAYFGYLEAGDLDAAWSLLLSEDDYFYGTSYDDDLRGYAGADTIGGSDGRDLVVGNGGNDDLFGGAGIDTVKGGAGNDQLFGDHGPDTLIGGGGNDRLFSFAQNDRLTGGAGADRLPS